MLYCSNSPTEVLDYINWVDSLLWREAFVYSRIPDLDGRWQVDLSFDQMAEIAGVVLDPERDVPGNLSGNVERDTLLYWPANPWHKLTPVTE